MYSIKKRAMALLTAIIIITLSGCSNFSLSSKGNPETQKKFEEYTENLFKESIVEDMISLHYTLKDPAAYGITDYEPTLGTYSLEDMKDSTREMKELQAELLGFKRGELNKEQQITYDILKSHYNTELLFEGRELYYGSLSPVTGIQVQLPVLMAEYEFNTERDVTDYLAILADMDDYYNSICEFEREKSKNGMFMCDPVVDKIIKGCQDFISTGEDNYLIEVFNEKVDALEGLSDESKANYKTQNHQTIVEQVIPGYENLIGVLEELKGTGKNDKGLFYYNDGLGYYEYLVRSKVGSSRSVSDLMELITSHLDKDFNKMSKSYSANSTIDNDSRDFIYPTYDPTEIIEGLKIKCQKDYPDLPEINYSIKYVHPSLEESSSPAFYLTPPIDDSNRNMIYINNQKVSENSSSLFSTLAHEGYPGHLYQNVYFNEAEACNLRRILSFTGYSEGWASYVEFESYYMIDGMSPDMSDFLSANASATLGLYAYLDVSINYEGWTLEETKTFLKKMYGIDEDAVVEDIFYAMVADPTSYLKYYVGYLEILELRTAIEEKLGDAFVLKDFHQQVLDMGPTPFDVLEVHVKEWADGVKKKK